MIRPMCLKLRHIGVHALGQLRKVGLVDGRVVHVPPGQIIPAKAMIESDGKGND